MKVIMNYQKIDQLKKELTSYINIYKSVENFHEKNKWLKILNEIYENINNINFTKDSWDEVYSRICKILYFFTGRMGSFSEVAPKLLIKYSYNLVDISEECLKLCWKESGKEVSTVQDSDLFNVGDKVHLIKYQLMLLSYGGHEEIADFAMNHTYEIIEILKRDVSNMPQYLIKYDNFKRVARHNSLKAVSL